MNFAAFAEGHGLILRDLIADGRVHRVPTEDHRHKRNGAYRFDGNFGWVQNWSRMQGVAIWRSDDSTLVSRIELTRLRKTYRENEVAKQAYAAREAARLISECQRAAHPYLAFKGFSALEGLVHPGGDLIIPMRDCKDYGRVNSVQRIAADGSKLFLPGGKAKGSVFILGKGAWKERWLCEGYATGLSIQAALMELRRQAEIWVCFSAGNLQHVATMVKRPAFVFADNDASQTGQKAAEATGLPWVMAPEVGMDANDMHQKHGIRALVALIRGCRNV